VCLASQVKYLAHQERAWAQACKFRPPCVGLWYFLKLCCPILWQKIDDLSSILVDDALSIISQNPAIMVVGKTKFLFLQPKNLISNYFFYPKLLRNTLETLLNQFMTFKNVENHPKTHNLPKTKIFLGPHLFLGILKVIKHIILTPLVICKHLIQK
jgi:hypothetical protein